MKQKHGHQQTLLNVLQRCDHKMLRYMAGVEDISVKLRQRRLRWFRHVKRAEDSLLKEVEEVKINGR